jgi:hypothetical protein
MTLLGLVILFLLIAVLRKWVFEALDYPFNFILGEAGGIVGYILIYGFTGSYKIALGAGIIFGLVAGYFGASFWDTSGGDQYG